MSEKCNSSPPSAIPVKYRGKAICIRVKLYAISRQGKGEPIVHMWLNVRFGYSCARTICDNTGRIMESMKSGTTVFV
jgi:hypothetical protein